MKQTGGVGDPRGGMVWLLAAFLLAAPAAPAALEDEVRAYEAADALSPPPAGATLFVGSSSIRGWSNLAASFPDRPVLNRGFGGSQMSDLLAYFHRLVVPYAPPLMVVYEGDNDLATTKSVADVFEDYLRFTALAEHRVPGTEIVFLAVKPSPSRLAFLPKVTAFNALLRDFCAGRPHLRFVDVATPMLTAEGIPRPELYQSDQLHMVAAGYDLWTSILQPVVAAAPFQTSRYWLIDFGVAQASTVLGPPPSDPVNTWNNLPEESGTVANGSIPDLRTTQGTSTGMSLVVSRPFAGANDSAMGAGGLFPDSAVQDSLYGHGEEFNGRAEMLPAFRLNGLNHASTYHFTFFASCGGVADNRETVYTVTGTGSRTAGLDAATNVDGVAVTGGVLPDAEGGINIELAPGPANTSPPRFVYLGVLLIEERPPAAPVSLVEQPESVTLESGQPAVFRVSAKGSSPLAVQWFRNGEAIHGATDWMLEIPAVTEEMSGSRYRARVADAVSEVFSHEAVLSVIPDTTPPSVVRAVSGDGVVVEILFSEKLDPASVSAPTHFFAHGGLVPVTEVRLDPAGRTLVLTLAHRVAGNVPLQLGALTDGAGNALPPGTEVNVLAPVDRPRTFLIDFGSSGTTTGNAAPPANDPEHVWNNITAVGLTDSGKLDSLVSTDGQLTTAGLQMLSRFNGANGNGTLAAPDVPSNASRDSLFGNTETFNGLSNVFPSFKLTGLTPRVPLHIAFYASRLGVSDNRETGYTVVGETSGFASLNAANNVTGVAEIRGILPTDQGEIVITLAPTAANSNTNHFTYLGMMRVVAAEPVAWRAIHQLTPTTLVLDWTGTAHLEWSTELSPQTWIPIIPPPAAPWFVDISGHANRFYRLREP